MKSDSSTELLNVKCNEAWRITFQRYGSIIFFLSLLWNGAKRKKWIEFRLQQTAKAKMEVLGVVSPKNGIMWCITVALFIGVGKRSTCYEGDPKLEGGWSSNFLSWSKPSKANQKISIKLVLVVIAVFPVLWSGSMLSKCISLLSINTNISSIWSSCLYFLMHLL